MVLGRATNEFKNWFALRLWIRMRKTWSSERYGPVATPDLRGKTVLVLAHPEDHGLQNKFLESLVDQGADSRVVFTLKDLDTAKHDADFWANIFRRPCSVLSHNS